jgi:hypothetical protein
MTRVWTSIGLATVLAVCAVRASSRQPQSVAAGDWSDPVNGLRGRLVLTPDRQDDRPQLKLDLELENRRDSLGPLEIRWDDPPSRNLQLSLEDEAGSPVVDKMIPGGNERHSLAYHLAIPKDATIRIPITERAYAYQPDGQVWLRPFAFVKWTLPTNRSQLYLRGSVRPLPGDEPAPALTWKGSLPLPRVRLPIPLLLP